MGVGGDIGGVGVNEEWVWITNWVVVGGGGGGGGEIMGPNYALLTCNTEYM